MADSSPFSSPKTTKLSSSSAAQAPEKSSVDEAAKKKQRAEERRLKREREALQNSLRCLICLDKFSKPKTLNCLHSFCADCLKSYISLFDPSHLPSSSKGLPPCPLCRASIELPPGGVDDLPNNELVVNSLASLELAVFTIGNRESSCSLCKDDSLNDASFRCTDCEMDLCSKHERSHSLFPAHQSHNVVSLIEREIPLIKSKVKCPVHEGKKCKVFCATCLKVICFDCAFSSHKNCNTSLISTIIDKKIRTLRGQVEEVASVKTDLIQSVSNLDEVVRGISSQMKVVEETIVDAMDSAIIKICERKEELIKALKKTGKIKIEKLAQQRKGMDADLSCVVNSIDFAGVMIDRSHESQFMSHFHQVQDHLERLKEDQSFFNAPCKSQDFGVHIDQEAVDSFIKNIGKIVDHDVINYSEFNQVKSLHPSLQEVRDVFFHCPSKRTFVASPAEPSVCVLDESGKLLCDLASSGVIQAPTSVTVSLDGIVAIFDVGKTCIHLFDAEGSHFKSFGEKGSRQGEFKDFANMIFDRRGNLFVCDSGNDRVQVFDKQGCFLRQFGQTGSAAGEFRNPSDVAISNDGKVIISDSGNNRIQILDFKGRHISTIGAPRAAFSGSLLGVVVNKLNQIIVADSNEMKIHAFSIDGTSLVTLKVSVRPVNLTTDRQNNIIIVGDNGKIFSIGASVSL